MNEPEIVDIDWSDYDVVCPNCKEVAEYKGFIELESGQLFEETWYCPGCDVWITNYYRPREVDID